MATGKNLSKAVLFTGLVAGVLDAVAACTQFYINTGNNPARIFRFIASAALGKETMTKDLYSMAAMGLLFHMMIAIIWAFLFFLFFRQVKSVVQNKFVAGIIYGLFVWAAMNLLVVPLVFGNDLGTNLQSVFSPARMEQSLISAGIIIIAIGLPVSLLADRYYSKKIVS